MVMSFYHPKFDHGQPQIQYRRARRDRLLDAAHARWAASEAHEQAWNFEPDAINFFEYYDAVADPYLLVNIYQQTSQEQRSRYHNRAQAAGKCAGAESCRRALRTYD